MAEANIIERGTWKFPANLNYDHIDGCLPHELTLEILLRLPTKSLVRFKLVCKTWRSLISNSNFIKSHTLNSNNLPLTLLYDSNHRLCKCLSLGKRDDNLNLNSTVLDVNTFSFVDTIDNLYDLIGSCHGLICTYSVERYLIYLCNPLTKETKKISLPYPKIQANYYDIKLSWFGFVPSIDDYKILLVVQETQTLSLIIHIYSIRDDIWREVDTSVFKSLVTNGRYIRWGWNVALINETLHFCCFDTNHQNYIVAKFDLVQEIFELMPIILYDDNRRYCYGEFVDIFQGTSIYIFEYCICPGGWVMEAWKLEKYGKSDSWIKFFSIELSGFPIGFTSLGGLILGRPNPDDNHEYDEVTFVDLTRNPPNQIQLGRT